MWDNIRIGSSLIYCQVVALISLSALTYTTYFAQDKFLHVQEHLRSMNSLLHIYHGPYEQYMYVVADSFAEILETWVSFK